MGVKRTKLTPAAARSRGAGLKRAAFWRKLGFPNLVLARAARAKKRALARAAAADVGPYDLPGRPRGF